MKTRVSVLHNMGVPPPYKESKPLTIETVELDEPKEQEVLIRIRAAGLCHSDISVINGSRPRPTPMALGHEAAGEIIKVGEGVNEFQEGDHDVCTFIRSCGQCLPCKEGRPALCEQGAESNEKGEMLAGGRRLHAATGDIHHHLGVSGFAEYAVVSTRSIVKVNPEVPFEQIALFVCAVITGVGVVVNTGQVKLGSSVAGVGLGGIVLNAVKGAKLAGPRKIIALDSNPDKFESAKKLGATEVYDSSDPNVVKQIKENEPGGVEYAFETAGVVPAMEVAYQITKRGGTTTTTGLPHPDKHFSFPQVTLAAEERTVKGSYVGSCVPSKDIPHYVELFTQGNLPVDQLLTETITLDDINEGFDRLNQGEVARLVVTM